LPLLQREMLGERVGPTGEPTFVRNSFMEVF